MGLACSALGAPFGVEVIGQNIQPIDGLQKGNAKAALGLLVESDGWFGFWYQFACRT